MKDKYGTYYQYATGSITGFYLTVWRWTTPVYPTNNGDLWLYDPDTGDVVILED